MSAAPGLESELKSGLQAALKSALRLAVKFPWESALDSDAEQVPGSGRRAHLIPCCWESRNTIITFLPRKRLTSLKGSKERKCL